MSDDSLINSSTQDKVEGNAHQIKGAIKEGFGKLIDNVDLQSEGTVEKIEGQIQEKIGEIKGVFGR